MAGAATAAIQWHGGIGLAQEQAAQPKRYSVGGAALAPTTALVQHHPVHRQAVNAIVSEVLRWPLTWSRPAAAGRRPKYDVAGAVPVPEWCKRFVHDAVDSIAACGYAVYVQQRFETGPGLVVVPPGHAVLTWSSRAPALKVKCPHRAPMLLVIHPPSPGGGGDDDNAGVRSPATNAARDTARFDELERNFAQRDRWNSQHTVYTTVSSDLKNQNGSTRQWFRSALADEAAGTRPAVDTDFTRLIKRRADTVRQLAEHTEIERSRVARGFGGHGVPRAIAAPHTKQRGIAGPGDGATQHHVEHIVSDGTEYTQAHNLQSMSDGAKELDRAYTQIMLHYNVPPQIFGKNINTERHAASNRLTESAVQIFLRYTATIRSRLQQALATVSVDGRSTVAFRPVLDFGVLQRLAPALAPAFVAQALEADFGIPTAAVRLDRVADVVAGLYTPDPPPGPPPKRAKTTARPDPAPAGSGPAAVNRKEDKT